jgi:hypothetical protein
LAEEEISMKNTKAEILDALKRAKERATMVEKTRLSPEMEEKERTEKRAVESAK